MDKRNLTNKTGAFLTTGMQMDENELSQNRQEIVTSEIPAGG